MESVTKNRKNPEDVRGMIKKAFPGQELLRMKELEGGCFSAAYEVMLSDQRQAVLKIAPLPDAQIMSYEKNIMYCEVTILELVKKQTTVPVPGVYYYDDSCTVCESPYFFMEKIPGQNFSEVSDSLPEEEKKRLKQEAGKYVRQLSSVTGEKFGYPGQPGFQGSDWFSVFESMMRLAVSDARKLNIDFKIDLDYLFQCFYEDEVCFREIQTPRLVHWDLWDGNIFVENGKISGIIDFERAVWGDPLMEVGFRCYNQSEDFLTGYGQTSFSEYEKKRIFWYDIYLFMLSALEYDYRKYDTDETYVWAMDMMEKHIAMKREKAI